MPFVRCSGSAHGSPAYQRAAIFRLGVLCARSSPRILRTILEAGRTIFGPAIRLRTGCWPFGLSQSCTRSCFVTSSFCARPCRTAFARPPEVAMSSPRFLLDAARCRSSRSVSLAFFIRSSSCAWTESSRCSVGWYGPLPPNSSHQHLTIAASAAYGDAHVHRGPAEHFRDRSMTRTSAPGAVVARRSPRAGVFLSDAHEHHRGPDSSASQCCLGIDGDPEAARRRRSTSLPLPRARDLRLRSVSMPTISSTSSATPAHAAQGVHGISGACCHFARWRPKGGGAG